MYLHTGVITYSESYDILNPEESETWTKARLGLQNRQYEISESDRKFPLLEDINVIQENDARSILIDHDLMAFYEKF